MASESSLVRSTVRALVTPRRLLPVLLICAPMLAAQGAYSHDRLALPLGAVMCLLCVFVAPVSWRVLFPGRVSLPQGAVRAGLYAIMGAGVVLTLGVAVPTVMGMGPTFLTQRYSLAVCGGLFLVGGWGLGRDIGMEATLLEARRDAESFARQAERAQLLALRSHLDPHFLFNTLNAIAEWCRQDGEIAERAVLQLSSMLRTVLSGVKSPTWPLAQEVELMRTLFSLHLLRAPDLFTLEWDVDPDLLERVELPPMLLLPLAENAVKHGPASGHRGTLRVTLARNGEEGGEGFRFTVDNPGGWRGPRPGSEGLPTFQKRLAVTYAETARFEIGGDAERTCAILRVGRNAPIAGVNA